jgi:predicted metalloprotease
MRWQGRRQSGNVIDTRGRGGGGRAVAGVGGGVGIVGVILMMGVVYLMGGNPLAVLQQGGQQARPVDPAELERQEPLKQFVSVVLADTEDVFNRELPRQLNVRYVEPKLQLFSGAVDSACGSASAAVGPFYCPGDQQVYLDLSFFEELQGKLGARGDFAMAYVVAHEVGHHVQNLTGYSDKVNAARGGPEENRMSVRLELQADYLAGVFAHHAQKTKNILEQGDIEEGMVAAQAVGDDKLQREAQGYVVPDAFTHGTSSQRAKWFKEGFRSGDLKAMDQLFKLPYERL